MADAPVLHDAMISRLAREVARQITPIPNIIKTFGLDQETFDKLVDTTIFQTRLTEEAAIWNATDALSISKRISAKAATLIEMLKWASRLAGLTDNPNIKGGGPGEDARVKITINIGGNKLEFDKEKLPERVIQGDVVNLTPTTAS
jgi:hypothetical protein